jgi:hypothetical protein
MTLDFIASEHARLEKEVEAILKKNGYNKTISEAVQKAKEWGIRFAQLEILKAANERQIMKK